MFQDMVKSNYVANNLNRCYWGQPYLLGPDHISDECPKVPTLPQTVQRQASTQTVLK